MWKPAAVASSTTRDRASRRSLIALADEPRSVRARERARALPSANWELRGYVETLM